MTSSMNSDGAKQYCQRSIGEGVVLSRINVTDAGVNAFKKRFPSVEIRR